MAQTIGPSTDPKTATLRDDVAGSAPASFRYNNPGAQYPSAEAARFGQTGYGIIGGGHKIARFPSPVNGAASNLDLLFRNYVGMSIGSAGTKWTGANGFGVPGYDPAKVLTRELLEDPAGAIAFLKAIAGRESGKGSNLTEFQWLQAHDMFRAGSADAFLAGKKMKEPEAAPAPKSGEAILVLARRHIGEEYRNVLVPKDDGNWTGPWDCAEFVTWIVFQETGQLYGCLNNTARPAEADAYTGAWREDLESGRLTRVSVEKAAGTLGGILLRYPPAAGQMGHIAICDGRGGTVEAKGRRYGVVEDTVQGRSWDAGILIPGVSYGPEAAIAVRAPAVRAPANVYRLGAPNMDPGVLTFIKAALAAKGYFAGPGSAFDPVTRDAVIAFQTDEGLVVDGEVGSETAGALNVSLIPWTNLLQDVSPAPEASLVSILQALKDLLSTSTGSGATPMSTSQSTPTAVLEQLVEIVKTLRQQGAGQPAGQIVAEDRQLAQLRAVVEVLGPMLGLKPPAAPEKTPPLGQVNGALGQTIGGLLDGKKTAIGVLGALATQLLSAFAGTDTAFGKVLLELSPATGISQFALPVFLAVSAWGILGKFEKWSQGNVPTSSGSPKAS
jgi:hypothetical protein